MLKKFTDQKHTIEQLTALPGAVVSCMRDATSGSSSVVAHDELKRVTKKGRSVENAATLRLLIQC